MPKIATAKQPGNEPIKVPISGLPVSSVWSAVDAMFPLRSGNLVCRFLWEKNGVYRYRCNWMLGDVGDTKFEASSFLHIREEQDGLVVEDGSL